MNAFLDQYGGDNVDDDDSDSEYEDDISDDEDDWEKLKSPIQRSTEKVTCLQINESQSLCTRAEFAMKFEHKDDVFSLKGKKLEILEELGKGSQATVWKGAIDGRLVALKQINLAVEKKDQKNEIRRAVKYEVDLMKTKNHRNVMQYFGSFYSSKTQELNIITEICSGGPLTKYIQDQGCFTEVLCAHVLLQTLEGLAFIHSHRILHRDIKPDNLLVDLDGSVKLVDFGIAAQVQAHDQYRNSSVGTPWYTAPEVINGEDYSYACDIWSLGCTVIEMITGKPPFYHLNAVQTLQTMVEELPPLPATLSPELTDFLSSIFTRDWNHRPTAEDLIAHPFITHNLVNGYEKTIFLSLDS
uniref:Protein kinase domain-containing protein n=1 Tax=Paramoeba aestuarina TaxID=180227 RepID=A0A7S4PJM4_9EUKA